MDNVDRIQELWFSLTGFDPAKARADGIDNHHGWELQKTMKELRRAQELDPTDGLFLMLLEEQLDERLRRTETNAFAYLADPSGFDRTLALARELRGLLSASGMPEVRDDLVASVMRALDHYGAGDREDVRKLLGERGAIAYLWRDALEAMETSLETHQFLRGTADAGTKPMYQHHVLGFWSINDALRLCANMPSGISLCLIRDNEAINSYFAFVIRNGGNLWVITDRDELAHPLQAGMRRRKDRVLSERMGRSRFPYDLLDIQHLTDEDGDVVGLNVPRQEGIVPAQTRAFKVKPISDIAPDEVTWVAIMFALCTRRFFTEVRQLTELSYTGEMVELPYVIEKVASEAGLPTVASDYVPLQADPILASELTVDRMLGEGMVKASSGNNQWMVERYGHTVTGDLLARISVPQRDDLYIGLEGDLVRLEARKAERQHWDHSDSRLPTPIKEVDATGFGSARRILADRVWIARHNQAALVSMAAREEYDRRKDEVFDWWRSAVVANKDGLAAAVAQGGMVVASDRLVVTHGFQNVKAGSRQIMRRYIPRTRAHGQVHEIDGILVEESYRINGGVVLGTRQMRDNRHVGYRCFASGRPATDIVQFRPTLPEDLAAIVGKRVEDIPDVLQHWGSRPYFGNSILERVDPMDFVPKNPWGKLKFDVVCHISKHAFPRAAHVAAQAK